MAGPYCTPIQFVIERLANYELATPNKPLNLSIRAEDNGIQRCIFLAHRRGVFISGLLSKQT